MDMIRLQSVRKSYDPAGEDAVRSIDLRVERGELLILLGESGCGKTTTLKMINRLIEPTDGVVEVDGRDILERNPVDLRRTIGYVFQGVGLFPHMRVGENVGVVPRLLKWDDGAVAQRVDELLDLVGLPASDYRDRRPAQLSGGQRQRVGLARALAAKPKIMLMDEPFGALDPLTRDALQEEFLQIHRDQGLTTVMVTHDMTEALLLGDRIAVMRQGRIAREGAPRELLRDPRDDYTRTLMAMPKRHADRLEALAQADAKGGAP